jgi:hypothetical protein
MSKKVWDEAERRGARKAKENATDAVVLPIPEEDQEPEGLKKAPDRVESAKVEKKAKQKPAEKPKHTETFLIEGKINKYAFFHVDREVYEKLGWPQKEDIPVKVYVQNDTIVIMKK